MSADTFYSLTLLIAFTGIGLGLIAAFLRSVKRPESWQGLVQFGRLSMLVAAVCLLASTGVHYFVGHSPGSAEEMRMTMFFQEHISFLVAAILLVGGYSWWRYLDVELHATSTDL